MKRARLLAAAALALAAGACTSSTAPGVTVALRQPSALAVFRGYTLDDPSKVRPYLVIANASRNDLTVIDAGDDSAVQAPIQLRSLVIPVADRPALLAAASLGDDDPIAGARPDVLVAVTAGSSELQLIRTWTTANEVVEGATVDLGADVLALAVLPSPAGKARIAAALAGRKLAVVEYARSTAAPPPGADRNDEILPSAPVVHALGFQAVALAAVPGDEGHVYAASLEPVAGVLGVGEIDVAAPAEPWSVRALDARGPTRLVAAARLRERKADSTAQGVSAFDAQPLVPRVYAVLDESGCGLDRRVECGIVTLDPAKTLLGPGDDHIPEDASGRMPYRAPIHVSGRPLALAVSPPPAVAPGSDEAASVYHGDFMRLLAGASEQATTAVAAVASDDGNVYFLDLGRFKLATAVSTLAIVKGSAVAPALLDERRLWLQDATGAFAATADDAAKLVAVTPGYTRDATWSVEWQGALSSELTVRAAEVGRDGASGSPLWLALQAGGPGPTGRILNEVVKVFHPVFGVKQGDLVVLKAPDVPGCTGTRPPATPSTVPDSEVEFEFEGTVEALLAPTDAYPGGAVRLTRPDPVAHPEWDVCFTALDALVGTSGGVAARQRATIRASGLVLAGALGYAGRPELGVPYALEYPSPATEDTLAAQCPLADWDGTFPADPAVLTCGGAGCDRTVCEQLVLARKARRFHHNFEDCALLPEVAGCTDRWSGVTPNVAGPSIGFRVAVEGGGGVPTRGLVLRLTTSSGAGPASLAARATGSPFQASGAITFDRSTENGATGAAAGYRFLLSYPADLVFDVSPSVNPVSTAVIR